MGKKRNQDTTRAMKALSLYSLLLFSGKRYSLTELHLQRSTEALLDYLQGITCDDHLSDLEIANLQGWLATHHALRQYYPFDELTARLEYLLRDCVRGRDSEFIKAIVHIVARRVQS